MTSYLALGSGGCEFENALFSNFGFGQVKPVPSDNHQYSDQITITPTGSGTDFGFVISGPFAAMGTWATMGWFAEWLDYDLQTLPNSGNVIGASLTMNDPTLAGLDSKINISQTAGGTTLLVQADKKATVDTDSAVLNPANMISVRTWLQLGAGGVPHATSKVSSITEIFTIDAPEPAEFILAGSGLLALGFLLKRRKKG